MNQEEKGFESGFEVGKNIKRKKLPIPLGIPITGMCPYVQEGMRESWKNGFLEGFKKQGGTFVPRKSKDLPFEEVNLIPAFEEFSLND